MAVLGVTGATGLIGTRFAELASRSGHELRLFSRAGEAGLTLDLGLDSIDPTPLAGCEAIVHLAARLPSSGSDVAEAQHCFDVNALGTLKLMQAMAEAGVARLIQATAANAYAPWCEFPDEQAPLYPLSRSYYLGSKVLQEVYAHSFGAEHGIAVTSLRISSPYGPSPRSAIGRIAAALLGGKPVTLQNGGSFGADFIFIADVADAFLLLERLGLEGVWNVASGCRSTIRHVATRLVELTGADSSLIKVEASGANQFQGYPAVDAGKIRAKGFMPMDLDAGLGRLVDELRTSRPAGSSDRTQAR